MGVLAAWTTMAKEGILVSAPRDTGTRQRVKTYPKVFLPLKFSPPNFPAAEGGGNLS